MEPRLTHYQFAAVIIAAIGPLLAFARRIGAPESMLLFGVGLASTVLPGLPPTRLDPDMVITLFLPPLLYASTVRVSWHLLRFTLLPGVLLGALLVIVTIAAVALAAQSIFLLGLSWSAALLIGVVAAFFDTRLFHEANGRPRVPRAIADTLKARELVGRIFILAAFGLVEDSLTRPVTTITVLDNFLFDIPAGIMAGFLVGNLAVRLRQRIDPAPVEIAISVATPYVAALLAEAAGISVAASIITTALVVSAVRVDRRSGATISSSEARINATAFWEQANLMISSVVFLLAGRAVPEALRALQVWPLWQVAVTAAGLLALALTVQFCFAYAATPMRPIGPALSRREQSSSSAAATLMTWSSTRSVIGLLIALSVPATLPDGSPFRERDLILTVATLIVIGSVVLQGLSLRRLVDRAGLADPGEEEKEVEEARSAMRHAVETPRPENANAFDAVRHLLLRLRERDRIGDEVLARMMRETDLNARASEENALPGAGPPQP